MKRKERLNNIKIMHEITALLDKIKPYGDLDKWEITAIKRDLELFERQHKGIEGIWDKPFPLCKACKGWGTIRS